MKSLSNKIRKNNLLYAVLFASVISLISIAGCIRESKPSTSENELSKLYQEKYRSQIHFTPPNMWMNDPNGMVYYDGEYHLFYQYYPDSNVWGPMHWGHAISTDLAHWEHQPIALYPDSLGLIFSGSAIIDWENTSGFGSKENPPMVAIYTYHDMIAADAGSTCFQSQAIAYSLDKGRSWTKYSDNPVVKNPGIKDFRDPKVIWHNESEQWIMVLAAQDRVKLYGSSNLKEWEFLSDFGENLGAHGGVWECPDMFELNTSEGIKKWVMIVSLNPGGPNGGSAAQYFVGDFNGKVFIPETEKIKWVDYGKDNYAGVTWSDIPEEDGRRIFIGWMSNWEYATIVPTTAWRSAMTLPRKIELEKIEHDYFLKTYPVKEIGKLKTENKWTQENILVKETQLISDNFNMLSEIEVCFSKQSSTQFGTPSEFGLKFENELGEVLKIGYSPLEKKLLIDRSKSGIIDFHPAFNDIQYAPLQSDSDLTLNIFMDKASVEVFVNKGELALTSIIFPREDYHIIKAYSNEGNIYIKTIENSDFQSIWNTPQQ